MSSQRTLSTFLSLGVFALSGALCGCGSLSLYDDDRGEKLAQVGDSVLYSGSVVATEGLTPQDSLAHQKLFIEQWVQEQIRLSAALEQNQEHLKSIEDQIKAYRETLLKDNFQAQYIKRNINTEVTPEQIEQYYKANGKGFRLPGAIVKVHIARIPSEAREAEQLQELFRSDKAQDMTEFIALCQKNDYSYEDLTQSWIPFISILEKIPFSQTDFDSFLRKNSFYQIQDDQYNYMMRIEERRFTGDNSPLEMLQEHIKRIILHSRETELIKRLDDSLLTRALNTGELEIFSKDTTALTNASNTIEGVNDSIPTE